MGNEIRVEFPGGKRADALYKGFRIETDQPVYQGGEGNAPAPFDLFLASIATCAGFYVMAFFQMRNLPVKGLEFKMVPVVDPEIKRITRILIDIGLPPGFPERYHNAVAKAVNSCAIKAHLENPPQFEVNTFEKGID